MVGHVGCEEMARELASALAQQTGFLEEKMMMIEVGMVLRNSCRAGHLRGTGGVVISIYDFRATPISLTGATPGPLRSLPVP